MPRIDIEARAWLLTEPLAIIRKATAIVVDLNLLLFSLSANQRAQLPRGLELVGIVEIKTICRTIQNFQHPLSHFGRNV